MSDDFGDRCEALIESQRGKPFEKAEIEFDWIGRGNFTRRYAHSVTSFAMQAFFTDDAVDEANEAMTELCEHYIAHETDLLEAHSFHWSGALYGRLWSFFGPDGSVAANRIASSTQVLMLEMMWLWSKTASPILDSDPRHVWRFPNSENHHAMGIVTTWFFCSALSKHADYKDRRFDDGQTAKEHLAAWSTYLKAYFRSRAGKGQSVEIASKSYNAHTIQMWYNVSDFAEDEVLRRVATHFLDLYWATWAEEQIDGIRGGGKTRIYQGPASRTAGGGEVANMAALYLGTRSDDQMRTTDWVIATSAYRMPEIVKNYAREITDRGCYEITQRCMGLNEAGWERIKNPPVIPFGVIGLREDFGGFLRYSYCTPEFVVGTLMCEPRSHTDWSGVAAQNRWQGVIFSGHPDAAIVPECQAVDTHLNMLNHNNTMNQHWSVQRRGTLITQKLKNPDYSTQTGDSKVWISAKGLSDPAEEGGWVFVSSEGAYAGVYVADGGYELKAEGQDGWWIVCERDLSPIVIEVGRQVDHESMEAFRTAVLSTPVSLDGDEMRYESLAGDRFSFHTDYSALPMVNGETIDLTPDHVYDSLFVQSRWDSGVVELAYKGSSHVLDFNYS